MIRIGGVNIDTSHPLAFCEELATGSRARYVAVYNDAFRGDDEVDAFIKKFDLEKRCETIEELADTVDVGFIQSCNWDEHIKQAMPFIERGKPVFIDKPIVGNLADCRKLEELVAQGAVIIGSSSLRYCDEVVAFNKQPELERGQVMNLYGTAGVDEFNYGIHVVELIGGLVDSSAVSCNFVGSTEIDGKISETYFVKFQNGVTASYTLFIGVWQPFEVVIMTTTATHQFRVNVDDIYRALLDRICDFMESGKGDLASVDAIVDSVKIMLAGRMSREVGGGVVAIDNISETDAGYDGRAFEQGYASKAKKLYL